MSDGVIEPSNKRRKGNGVSNREYERLKSIAFGGESVRKDVVETSDTPSHDPWTLDSTSTNELDPQLSYLENPKPIKQPSTLKDPPISLLANTASLPAVPKPKPGTSYNPVFQDWDALLTTAGAAEVAAERRRLAEAAAEQAKQERIAAALNEKENDDYKTEDESAWEGFESEHDVAEWLKKKRPERKTPAERNKVKRRKEAERQAKWEAEMKKREKQAKQVESIVKEVDKEAKAKAKANALDVLATKENDEDHDEGNIGEQVLRRSKFGKHRYGSLKPSKEHLPPPRRETIPSYTSNPT